MLALHFFGEPHIEQPKKTFAVDTHKAVALLAYLAVTQQRHRRHMLASLLWPNSRHPRAALRRTLSALKKALNGDYLQIDRTYIALNQSDDIWVDVLFFQQNWEACRLHRPDKDLLDDGCLARLKVSSKLYRGEFLAEFYLRDTPAFDEWRFFVAERLRQIQLLVLERLVVHYQAQGLFDEAIEYAQQWVALEPLQEAIHYRLIQLYIDTGRFTAAEHQYQECVRLLKSELGVSPQPETAALWQHLQTKGQRPQLPLNTLHTSENSPLLVMPPINNIPVLLTPFIGRDAELQEISRQLANPQCHLLTISGPGGVGKTTLAIQAARQQLFRHGVVFVPLVAMTSADFLVSTIADALKLTFFGKRAPKAQLLDYLREKELLLVLDNIEHLENATPLILDILARAPQVKILATSRKHLNSKIEWLVEIAGLPYPQSEHEPDLDSYGAIQLFLHHARRVGRTSLSLADKAAIARICTFLEGIPLAIELATSLLHAFSCVELAQKIAADFDVLQTDMVDIPARHRSLRAVFDQSWILLNSSEQIAFSKLAVFEGAFSTGAAVFVAEVSELALKNFVTRSLLRRIGTDQYQLHALMRQYAKKKLSMDEAMYQQAGDRHAACYGRFLQSREAMLKRAQQNEALVAIEQAIDNIRKAWEWAVSRRQETVVSQACSCLARFYEIKGWYQEGLTAFSWAAKQFANCSTNNGVLPALLLARQGMFEQHLGDYEKAQQLLTTSLTTLRHYHAYQNISLILNQLGVAAFYQGDYATAQQLYEESLILSQISSDEWNVSGSLNGIGNVFCATGEYELARQKYQQGFELSQTLDDKKGMSVSLNGLGIVAEALGKFDASLEIHAQSFALCCELGDRRGMARSLHNQASILEAQGVYEKAQACWQQSLAIRHQIGDYSGTGLTLLRLGFINYLMRDYETAKQQLNESLEIFQETNEPPRQALALVKLGNVARSTGQLHDAFRLYTESLAIFENLGERRGIPMSLNGFGHLAQLTNKLPETSAAYFARALQIAYEIRALPLVLDVLSGAALCFLHAGQRPMATGLWQFIMHHPRCACETVKWVRSQLDNFHLATTVPDSPSDLETAVTQTLLFLSK